MRVGHLYPRYPGIWQKSVVDFMVQSLLMEERLFLVFVLIISDPTIFSSKLMLWATSRRESSNTVENDLSAFFKGMPKACAFSVDIPWILTTFDGITNPS